MREKDIRKYALLMEELGLQRLTVTEDGRSVSMTRLPGQKAGGVPTTADSSRGSGSERPETEARKDRTDHTEAVTSPMVGIFYAAPSEKSAPFVSVGDRVEEGDTLCIIEAMKLMNEIRAEKSGVIDRVCVTNGQMVEYGTELFRLRIQQ